MWVEWSWHSEQAKPLQQAVLPFAVLLKGLLKPVTSIF